MKTRIKGIAVLLTVILIFSGLLRGSALPTISDVSISGPPSSPSAPVDPSTDPTDGTGSTPTNSSSQPSTEPSTEPSTQPPTTQPPTTQAPTTQATTKPTQKPTTKPTTQATTQAPTPTEPPRTSEFTFSAKNAFVYRCEDNSFLYAHGNADGKLYPASVTKLFSAYVALLHVEMTQTVTVGNISSILPKNSSTAGLARGDVLTVEQLLYAMLLPSGNDAARALAVHVGRILSQKPDLSQEDAMAAFVDEMNRQAELVGMTGSHFTNPDGYHNSNHYTTMSDMMTVGKLCLDSQEISKICATTKYTANYTNDGNGKVRTWRNTNALLFSDSSYYIKETVGFKTGSTNSAGRCLLTAFQIDGGYYIAGVFGCSTAKTDSHFQSSCYLYDMYIKP